MPHHHGQDQRVIARRLIAAAALWRACGCWSSRSAVGAGECLLAVAVVYADWLALAVALVSVQFGAPS